MNFTYVEFPTTLDINILKAYFNLTDVKLPKIHGKVVPCTNTASDANGHLSKLYTNQPKSLRHIVLDTIAANWSEFPIYKGVPRQEDLNYMLSELDVNMPLKLLSERINEDFFWRRSYQYRWKTSHTQIRGEERAWINIYMERHLQEFIENMQTCDYDVEGVQATLEICAKYINLLEINCLKPSLAEHNDHIPLDYILSNLPELRKLRLTYSTKTIGKNFSLGCNMISQHDIVLLAKGLSRCYELHDLCIHNTKLESYQLRLIAHSLDKGCQYLTELNLSHCAIGDAGIRCFLEGCTRESFVTLKCLDLTNNKITEEGAYMIGRTLKSISVERLIMRLNPIQSDGAAAILNSLQHIPIKYLNLCTCSLSETITKLFMMLILQNKTLLSIDIANNNLGENFGKHLLKVICFNKLLQHLDLRNTGLTQAMRSEFKQILLKNFCVNRMVSQNSFENRNM